MNDADLIVKMAGDVEKLRKSVKQAVDVMGGIAESARKIADTANKAFGGMAKALKATFKAVANFVGAAIKEIINIVKDMSGAVFAADERLRALMSPEQLANTQSLAQKLEQVTGALKQMYDIVAEALVPVFHTVFDTVILPNLDDMFHLVGGIGAFITNNVLPAIKEWGPLIGDIAGHFITAFGDILNGNLPDAIARVAFAVKEVFGEGAGKMVYDFLQGVLGVGGEVQAFDWGGAFRIISDALTGAWNTAVAWFNDVGWPGFMALVSSSWAALQTWWANEGWPGFYNAMVALWDWFINVGWPFLVTTIQTAWNNLQVWWANEGWPGLVKAWDDLGKWWVSTGAPGLNALIESTWTTIQATVTWLGTQVGTALLTGLLSSIGINDPEFLKNAIAGFSGAFTGALGGIQNRAGQGMFAGEAVVGEAGPEIVRGAGTVSNVTNNHFNLTMNVDRDTAGALSHSFKMMQAVVGT